MHKPSSLQTAGAASAPTGLRRRPQSTHADQLLSISERFDRLQYDVSLGIKSQGHYDRLATEAEEIAKALRATFRRAEPEIIAEAPVNPPLWQKHGRAIW